MSRLILVAVVLVFLTACNQAPTEESVTVSSEVETSAISFDEIINALEKQGVNLKEANLPPENIFIQHLNDVSPQAYSVEGDTLSIYVFPSLEARKDGIEEFKTMTATAGLEYSENFIKENILIFYVIEPQTEKETISRIRSAIEPLD